MSNVIYAFASPPDKVNIEEGFNILLSYVQIACRDDFNPVVLDYCERCFAELKQQREGE